MDGALLGVIGTVVGMIVGVLGFMRLSKADSKNDGQSLGIITSELGYLKAGQDDLKRGFDRFEGLVTERHIEVTTRLTAVEESTKQAHKRINEFHLRSKEE